MYLKLVLFKFSATNIASIVPTSVNPPREARIGVGCNLSNAKLKPIEQSVLIVDDIIIKTPHDIDSPIGNAISAQNEYPTPIIGITEAPNNISAIQVKYIILRSIISTMNTTASVDKVPTSINCNLNFLNLSRSIACPNDPISPEIKNKAPNKLLSFDV